MAALTNKGAVILTPKEASVVARALRAFIRDDSEIAFKDGDLSFEDEHDLLFDLTDELLELVDDAEAALPAENDEED